MEICHMYLNLHLIILYNIAEEVRAHRREKGSEIICLISKLFMHLLVLIASAIYTDTIMCNKKERMRDVYVCSHTKYITSLKSVKFELLNLRQYHR